MLNYYDKLSVYTPDYVEAGSYILINEVALIKDTVNDEILLRVTMANGNDVALKAVAIQIQMRDIFNDDVLVNGSSSMDYIYQDTEYPPQSIFGNTVPIKMPDNVRSVDVKISKAVFSDGSVWKSNPDSFVHVQPQDLLEGTDEFLETLRKPDDKYPPLLTFVENDECWQCTCGGINKVQDFVCYRCGRKKELCKQEFSAIPIHKKYADYVGEQERLAEEIRIKAEQEEAERKRLEELERQRREEELRIERAKKEEERKKIEEQRRIEQEEKDRILKKKRKRNITILSSFVVAGTCIALYIFVLGPMLRYEKAGRLYNNGNYIEAEKEYATLGDYKDSDYKRIQAEAQKLYAEAGELSEEKQFQEAYNKLATLLKDTAFLPKEYEEGIREKAKSEQTELLYQSADLYCESGEYGKAIKAVEQLQNEDGEDVTELLLNLKYLYAKQFAEKEDYKSALLNLQDIVLEDNKDAYLLYYKCLAKSLKEGDVIQFGEYEQDGNKGNGAEAIQWIVLDNNKDHFLIVSKSGLEAMKFGDTVSFSWENSIVRKWLNTDFYNLSFTDAERKRILKISVTTVLEKGKESTIDYITIPDKDIISNYLTKAQWSWEANDYLGKNHGWCEAVWLRNISGTKTNKYLISVLRRGGFLGTLGRSPSEKAVVRPMMWIDLSGDGYPAEKSIRIVDKEESEDKEEKNTSQRIASKKSASSKTSTSSSSSKSSGSNSSSSSSGGYGYDPNDPYYSNADHNRDGKINDDEFQDAMGAAIDDLASLIGG